MTKNSKLYARIIIFPRGHTEWGFTVCLSYWKDDFGCELSLSDKQGKNNDLFLCDGDSIYLTPIAAMTRANKMCRRLNAKVQWKFFKTHDNFGNHVWPVGVPVPPVPKKYDRNLYEKRRSSKNTLAKQHWDRVALKKALRDAIESQNEKKAARDGKLLQIQKEIQKLGCTPVKFITTRTKFLKDITAADIPPGLDAEDIAIDCAPDYHWNQPTPFDCNPENLEDRSI
jgi:hypothetical protein